MCLCAVGVGVTYRQWLEYGCVCVGGGGVNLYQQVMCHIKT